MNHSKAPFGVNEKRFLNFYKKTSSSADEYNVPKYPNCKITSFIYPPFNTTSERFMFNKELFIRDLSHKFYYSSSSIDAPKKEEKKGEDKLRIVGRRLFI